MHLLALLAVLSLASTSVPCNAVQPDDAQQAASCISYDGTVVIGGGVILFNDGPGPLIITPRIGGVAGDPVVIMEGRSHNFPIPPEVSLIGHVLDLGHAGEYLITAP